MNKNEVKSLAREAFATMPKLGSPLNNVRCGHDPNSSNILWIMYDVAVEETVDGKKIPVRVAYCDVDICLEPAKLINIHLDVSSTYKGQGYGSSLVSGTEKFLAKLGFTESAVANPETPKFWENMGYRPINGKYVKRLA